MSGASTANPRAVPGAAKRGNADPAARGKATTDARRRSARIRAASLGRVLLAIAPNRGSAITLSVTTKRGVRVRSTFSHPSVLLILRRALADAQATSAAQANPQPSQSTAQPARVAASA